MTPRHVAVIGGEEAATAAVQCAAFGFAGPIWGVNPHREQLGGQPCFPSVTDLPEPPDAVFLAVPPDAVPEVVAQLRDFGAGGVSCFTAGFGEAGIAGQEREAALAEAAGDLALVGPNCFGLIDGRSGLALWPYGHGCARRTSGVAVVSQSGMFASDLTMARRSLPIACVVSCGNQAVLAVEDFMDVLLDDPAISAIGLYVEELRDIAAFARVALRALASERPVVALKVGASKIGAALTVSHTGSLAGSDDLYQALFERLGVIRAESPAQLLESLKMLAMAGAPRGRRLGVFTGSGGDAAMVADLGAKAGLGFPAPPSGKASVLRQWLPDFATVSNPLDLTHHLWGRPEVTDVVRTMIGDGYDAALLVQDYPRPDLGIDMAEDRADARSFALAAREAGIPAAICSSVPENMDRESREFIAALGAAPLQGVAEALQAIAHAAGYGERLGQIRDLDDLSALLPAPLPALTAPVSTSGERTEQPSPAAPFGARTHQTGMPNDEVERAVSAATATQALDEWASKQMLAAAGIPVPPGRRVALAEAAVVADTLGYPVFVKLAHGGIVHKTDAGLLAGPLGDPSEVSKAAARIARSVEAGQSAPGGAMFLVEQAVLDPVAEILVGIRRDEKFGLAMVLASGGVLTELVRDSQTLLLPTNRDDIVRAVRALRSWPLLQGYRGGPPGDVEALMEALTGLSTFACGQAERILEIEINPLMVTPRGVVAADALITVCKP